MVGVAVVLLAGCGATDSVGSPDDAPRTVVGSAAGVSPGVPAPVASAARAPVVPAPSMAGEATCARGARPVPSVDPSASFDLSDPGQRARRALAEQHRPTPSRGVVAQGAIPGAEACVYFLKLQFSLHAAGSRTAPDEQTIAAVLRSAGLTKIAVRSGPVFAASTGAACVHGGFTTTGPAFVLGPLAADGSCRA